MYLTRILLIEDDDRLREITRKYLLNEQYEVIEAPNGKEAMFVLADQAFDLILLDVMLPDMDGWTILRKIRETLKTPVIMLTARSEEEDKVFGFELGADDYVTKPYSSKELMARIKARLKDTKVTTHKRIELGDLIIKTDYHEVTVGGQEVVLTALEYSLLLYFIDNKNIVLNRNQILDHVWGYDYFGDERTVDTHVKRLRQKLGEAGTMIATVRGHGYRMVD